MDREDMRLIVQTVRSAERLRALVPMSEAMAENLVLIVKDDEELGPEGKAMMDLLLELSDAMTRTLTFLDARIDARLGKPKE